MVRKRNIPKLCDYRVKTLASGQRREYWFFRPLGMAAGRLPGVPEDPEFHAEYARKLAAWKNRNAPNPDAATLGELITLYKADRSFKDLSTSAQRDYGAALDAIGKQFGRATPLKGVLDHPRMAAHIEAWHESMAATPRKADLWLAVLHRLISFGIKKHRLEHNRAGGIKRLYQSRRAKEVWPEGLIDSFRGSAPPEMAAAVGLAYATGQRQGDLLSLCWNDVTPEGVTFRTSKTGVRLFVPTYDELAEVLALIPRRGVQVLTMPNGSPWKTDTFRHTFKAACRAAEVPETLHFHDLRGSALKAFADAGASELELRAISGHSMKQMAGALGSYIDAFRSLAEGAVRKRENARRTKMQTVAANRAISEGGE